MGVTSSKNKLKTVKEEKGPEKEAVPTVNLTAGKQVNIARDNRIKYVQKVPALA